MTSYELERASEMFILHAIQEWGQPENARIAAVQCVLGLAGFDATATCWPIFGGIWPKPCEGPDGEKATAWLSKLTDTIPRGHFEWEARHVRECIDQASNEKAVQSSEK